MKAILMDVLVGSEGGEERLMFSESAADMISVCSGKKELFHADVENMMEICRELLDTFGNKVPKVNL
jgi:hypothetical protein